MAKKTNMYGAATNITPGTKKPSGLTIARKGSDLTFKWKIADKNYGDGQQLQWQINNGEWNSVSISKTQTAKTVSITLSNYRPTHKNKPLKTITFKVRGRRSNYTEGTGNNTITINPQWSDWSFKTLTLDIPRVPSVSAALSSTYDNITTFSWSVNTANTDDRFFRDVKYQTCLIKDSGATGSKYDKKFGSTVTGAAASGSVTKTENTTTLAQGSYTRWYRFRSRGSKGSSDWKYIKHVYAMPYKAEIKKSTYSNGKAYVSWVAPSNAAHPIDTTTVQYSIVTPNAGLACPSTATWTDAETSKDTKELDAAKFSIDQAIGVDECLYYRVATIHDRETNYSKPALATGGVGKLSDPTNLSVTNINNTTHRATITATNNSSVPDSFLAIIFRTAKKPNKDLIVGVIPHGSSSVNVQCPDWDNLGNFSFGVYAVAGTYTNRTVTYGNYQIKANMKSASTLWDGGTVPVAPSSVTVNATDYPGIILVGWSWAWSDADISELSWSDDPTAWESTTGPSTYEVNNTNAAQWYISGLETGKTWYVRVRLIKTDGDSRTIGPYSEITSIDLSSAPSVPVLALSAPVMRADGDVTASWAYSSTDGTDQAYAEITTVEINADGVWYGLYALTSDNTVVANKDYFSESGGIYSLVTPLGTENPSSLGWYEIVPNIIAHTETAQHVTINAAEQGWSAGDSYDLAVRVVSASGRMSDSWSDPVGITVADPITATISTSSLVYETYVDTADMSRDIYVLKAMPLTVTVVGAGDGGTTTVAIERAASYHMDRPDETTFNGYEGETIALVSQVGEAQMTIDLNNLIGRLDDGAAYRLVATVNDDIGQSAEATLDFEVHWTHQALMPTATVSMDNTNYIAYITPVAPVGTDPTDVFDIYRLSVDKPQLVVENGSWGTTYVDPYPTIGEQGGHRVVFKSKEGDYITATNQPAWVDLTKYDGDILNLDYSVIDFDGNQLECYFNQAISNSFEKDFQETRYLGGAIQGDWNPGVRRTGSVNGVFITTYDPNAIRTLRQLAAWPGICHVRTKDGSSYAADVQVGDDVSYDSAGKVVSASLTITRVDPEGYDGMSQADWEEGTS